MKKIALLAFLLTVNLAHANIVETIQRHKLIGGSADGKRLAVLSGHFGPSSHAPFVNLTVKEAGRSEPLLLESLAYLEGGEEQLAQLETAILDQSRAKLTALGIEKNKYLPQPATAYWAAKGNRETTGTLDLKQDNKAKVTFGIQRFVDDTCAKNSKGRLNWRVLLLGDSLASMMQTWNCLTTELELRQVYQASQALWFFVQREVSPVPGMQTYWTDYLGVALP